MVGGTVVFTQYSTETSSSYIVYCNEPIESAWEKDQKLLEAQRVASRRIIPPTRMLPLRSHESVSVLIRWMAKALIGGQK